VSEAKRCAPFEHDPIAKVLRERRDHREKREVSGGIFEADPDRIGGILQLIVAANEANNRHETRRCSRS
jgi:hypothetical protein